MALTNSGMTYRVINTLERALSSDANEFQLFGAASTMELFRRLFFAGDLNPSTNDGFEVESQPVTVTDPLTGYVAGGLLVNPQGTSLLIDQGTLLAIAPDPVPDARDSVCVVAHSAGVVVAGQIPFVANAGAGPRWDILECRPQLVTATSTRDIFNPVTQQFVSQSVDKLVTTSIEFRLRAGTAASPATNPGTASGWTPIAAVWTPTTAASFDDCEIFDVRPLVRDLSDYGAARQGVSANRLRSLFSSNTSAGNTTSGSVAADFVGPGRKWSLSGRLQATESEQDAGLFGINLGLGILALDTTDSRYWEFGTESDYSSYFHLSLVFPFGLPRWKRLGKVGEAISGRRWPCGPGGFLVLNAQSHGMDGVSGQVGISNGYDTTGQWDAISLGVLRTAPAGMGAFAIPVTMLKNEDGWHHLSATTISNAVSTADPDPTSLTEQFETDPMPRTIGAAATFLPSTVPISGVRMWLQTQITRDPTTDAYMEILYYPTHETLSVGFFSSVNGNLQIHLGATDIGGTGDRFPEMWYPCNPRAVDGSDVVQISRFGTGTTGPAFEVIAWVPQLRGFQVQWQDAEALT